MMTMLRGWITMIVMLTAINAQACSWPAWEQESIAISQQGRVIDPGDARKLPHLRRAKLRHVLAPQRTVDWRSRNFV